MDTIDDNTKRKLAHHIRTAVKRAGSQARFAKTIGGISTATVSHMLQGKWVNISDRMWQRVASALRFETSGWQTAPTRNFELVQAWCHTAQQRGITIPISHDPGTGKTEALKHYAQHHKEVYYVQCAEHWTRKLFFQQLTRALGIDPAEMTIAEMAETIICELRIKNAPLVIFDEMDKLKDPLVLFFIELYNKLDELCGFIIAGTPYLRIQWEKNAKRDKKGFAEIHSRLGRRYMHLNKLRRQDVQLVAEANGITDEAAINAMWNEVEGSGDLRRVRREVLRIQLQEVNTEDIAA